jgi:hypothetical protein
LGQSEVTLGHHLVRIEAKGFRGMISRSIADEEDRAEIDFHLEPAAETRAVLLTPADEPAVDAVLVVGGEGNPIQIVDGKPASNGDRLQLRSGPDGEIDVPAYTGTRRSSSLM